MRKKLFAFFMLILFFGVSITGFVSYDFMKNWIVESTKKSLRSESVLINEYAKMNGVTVDFDKLSKEIKRVIDRRVTIIDLKGNVVGESDLPKDKLQNHLYREEIQQAIKTGEGYSLRYSDTEKIPMYYFAMKTNINDKAYIIRLAVKLTAIQEMQYSYLKIVILAISIGIIISGLLVILYLYYFVKPINSLTKMASAMATGKYDKRILTKNNDEIGELGNAFNTLSEKLEITMNDLADQQSKLVSILTSMDDGVIVLDKNEKIMLINPAAKRLFEIDNEVTGKYFIEAIRNYDFENIIQSKPDEDVEITVKGQLLDKGQTSKNFRIRTTKVISNDEKHDNELVLLVVQDITKIKALEEMRTDFVANVSHELKTPLTSIKGFAETLKMVDDKETKDKFLDIINVEAERLTRLINDILTLSEIESKGYSVNMNKIDINSIILDVFHIMEPVAKSKNIMLSYENQGDVGTNANLGIGIGIDVGVGANVGNGIFIQGDKDKFKQMMINLVDNAIKYTNNNGTVKIKTLVEAGDAIVLVEDNGIGIPRESISRLFERFYRVDKARSRSMGGTGLGLAIVKHILILFNGSIEVKSEVGKGTTFTIFLPLA